VETAREAGASRSCGVEITRQATDQPPTRELAVGFELVWFRVEADARKRV